MTYAELIKRLRECTAEQNGEKTLWHQAADAIEELQDAIEELQTVVDGLTAQTSMVFEKTEGRTVIKFEPKWIPVTERLPEDEVLCINDRQFYLVGLLYCDDVGNYICETDGEIMYDVTHWMPLPQPPKEE